MRTLPYIIGIAWAGFWLYWLMSAVSAKRSKAGTLRQFVGTRLAMIGVAAVLVAVFHHFPQVFRNQALGSSTLALTVGLVLFALGLVLSVWARRYLGRNWGMPMTQIQNAELVTTGPYGLVRHPIYSGILLMILGTALDIGTYWLVPFGAALVLFGYSAVVEERRMLQQFPETYPTYTRRTKMLIPFIL